jgi:hypothetical protein
MLELGHALLAHLAEQTPSRQLVARFAADALIRLPSDGFVPRLGGDPALDPRRRRSTRLVADPAPTAPFLA